MDELDRLLKEHPPVEETAVSVVAPVRKCWRHDWLKELVDGTTIVSCTRCLRVRNEASARMGKRVGRRSKHEEREIARHYPGGKRVGHLGGPDDVQSDLFVWQSKAGTGWWSQRYADELTKLPRQADKIPVLVISNGKPGGHVRRFVVIDERDWRDLHGNKVPE